MNDSYEKWYDEAICAANELGYACMSAADVIRLMGAELKAARQQAVPSICDGKEQDAFEAWGAKQGMVMYTHPFHWLFLDAKTNAARNGWKGAIEYCRASLAAPQAAPQAVEACEVSGETYSSDGTSDIITVNLPIGTKLYTVQPTPDVSGLVAISRRILAKLYSETESVTALDAAELESALAAALERHK